MQQEADRIMTEARRAQVAWAELGVLRRLTVLSRLRCTIAAQCEAIAETIAHETSKPLLDALSGDVLVTLEMMRFHEAHAPRILSPRRIGKPAIFFRGARFESHCEPHGVALIFGPSNYPFQLSMVPLVTALAAGNAVVLKCSERTPQTSELIAKLCADATLPRGLVQVLHASPEDSTALIDAKPDILFFTGSSDHGRIVAERAARYTIPVILELGGKDAAMVFADCHLERAVEGIAYGAFSNGGRVCVGVKRAYIEACIYDDFVVRLRQRMAHLRVGAGPDVDLCPPGRESPVFVRGQVEDALARGATLQAPRDRTCIGFEPVLLTGVPADSRILKEECFGPVLCVAPFKDETQATALANESTFALGSSVWTRDRARARRVAMRLSSGTCAVNDVIRVIANPYAAFGGNKMSGYGRYHGPEGLRAFSRVKTVMIAGDRRAREINWFPFTNRTRRRLAGLIHLRHGQSGFLARLGRLLLPLLLGMFSSAATAQSMPAAELTIQVRLSPQAHGELAYLVFDSPAGFPGDRDKAMRHGFATIPAGVQQMSIRTPLVPGTYAVTVYDDLNGNHKLDHNLLGIPREPVGASNNPRPRMGPPRFNECSFHMGGEPLTISISLVQ